MPNALLFGRIVEKLHRGCIGLESEGAHQFACSVVALFFGITAKFQEQEATAFRKERNIVELQMLLFKIDHKAAIQGFKADWPIFADFRDVIGGVENVGVAEDQKRANRRTLDQTHGGF